MTDHTMDQLAAKHDSLDKVVGLLVDSFEAAASATKALYEKHDQLVNANMLLLAQVNDLALRVKQLEDERDERAQVQDVRG